MNVPRRSRLERAYHLVVQFPYGRFELAKVGQSLGLHVHVSDNRFPTIWHPLATIRGIHAGVALAVQRFATKRGIFDRAKAAFWPPLDLGLHLQHEVAAVGALKSFFGSQDVVTGDAAFDGPMRIQADEPERARALLGPRVRRALSAACEDTFSFEVSDQGITVEVMKDKTPWGERVPLLAHAVAELGVAARALPVATALRPYADALAPIAEGYGLSLGARPLSAAGPLAGLHVTVLFRRVAAKEWVLELATTLSPADPLGLVASLRKGALAVEPFALCKPTTKPHEVATEDAAFDARFRVEAVTGGAREVRQALLRSPLRREMLALSARFDVRVQWGTLMLRTKLKKVAPHQLRAWIDEAATGVRALGERTRAYRS